MAMFFDRRLFALTRGVRLRIALAALLGLVALPVAIERLVLQATVLARVFQGQPVIAVLPLVGLIGLLILIRAGLQFSKEEVASRTAAKLKVSLRRQLYEHVLALGPGY